MLKKTYETPDAQLFQLRAKEELLAEPSISDNGYGYDDVGPLNSVNGDL